MGKVADKWDFELADTTLVALNLGKGQVGKDRVDADAENFCVEGFEFGHALGECDDFSRADECEVERVEEKNSVLSFVVVQADVLDGTVWHKGLCFERWGGLTDERGHD